MLCLSACQQRVLGSSRLEIALLGTLGVKFSTMYASLEGPRKRRMQRVTDEREEIQSLWSLSGLRDHPEPSSELRPRHRGGRGFRVVGQGRGCGDTEPGLERSLAEARCLAHQP